MTTIKPKATKARRAELGELLLTAPGTARELSGGCLSVLDNNYAWVADSSIDLVLTDPPFNIAQDTNFHTYEENTINSYRFDEDKGWDTYTHEEFLALLSSWAVEFARVLRPGGSFAVFCADAYVSHLIDALTKAGLNPRRTLTWRKPNAVPINRKTMMMSSCEYVVVGVKGSNATFNSDLDLADYKSYAEIEQVLVADKVAAVVEKYVRAELATISTTGVGRVPDVVTAVKVAISKAEAEAVKKVKAMYIDDGTTAPYIRGCVPNDVSFNSKAGNRLHPTEKPVTLLSYLTALMSNPGDVLLDPFAGSGSAGEAALTMGRKIILVEQDKEFFGKLSKRVKDISAAQKPETSIDES